MMKRLVVLLFVVGLLTACAFDNTNSVKLYEMDDFDEIKGETLTLYTEKNNVAIFEQAIDSAVQLPGIADVISPGYLFEFEGKSYYLWLHEEDGSLMDTADTYTIYRLTELVQ